MIKAETGSGKTVLLRRIAWEAAEKADAICIFIRQYGQLRFEPIYELCRSTEKRIFVFIDNAADNVQEIGETILKARKEKLLLTIISAERINEWNMACESIDPYVTETYKLPYLKKEEIERLLDLLEKHNSLGSIKTFSRADQIQAFEKRAGRQLLVALHEATLGKPFEDILLDEYNEIRPMVAQRIYLSVCVLNRLNVFVRAGLISRIYKIPFTEFKNRFLGPLEHVVQISEKPGIDYLYSARHPHIASVVFDRILTDQKDRFNHYMDLLSSLNISYSTDRDAFRRMIRGKSLLDIFPDHQMVINIFEKAEKVADNDYYVFHQKGIYEMHRANGSPDKAYDFLQKARELSKNNPAIIHSLAELARMRAEKGGSNYEKERYRNEARKLCLSLLHDEENKLYASVTLIKILLDQLKEALSSEKSLEKEIDSYVEQIERYLMDGLQQYPDNEYLLVAESEFHKIMQDEEKALASLKHAFEANKRNVFIASRLSKIYLLKNDKEGATKIIKEAIDSNPADKQLHFRYAMLLKQDDKPDFELLLYHLQRSFHRWDQNYEAQFWYAVYCFISGQMEKIAESMDIFKRLKEIYIPYELRIKIRHKIKENGKDRIFTGRILRVEDSYGFILEDNFNQLIFMHSDYLSDNVWSILKPRQRVQFEIAFNFCGPIALSIGALE